MMFVCLASRHTQISLDLMMESDSFFFFFFKQSAGGRKKKRWRQRDGGAAQPSSAYLFSSLLSCLFFPLSLPYTKALMCAAMCFAIVLCLKA